jgi:hypothetical protein
VFSAADLIPHHLPQKDDEPWRIPIVRSLRSRRRKHIGIRPMPRVALSNAASTLVLTSAATILDISSAVGNLPFIFHAFILKSFLLIEKHIMP